MILGMTLIAGIITAVSTKNYEDMLSLNPKNFIK